MSKFPFTRIRLFSTKREKDQEVLEHAVKKQVLYQKQGLKLFKWKDGMQIWALNQRNADRKRQNILEGRV